MSIKEQTANQPKVPIRRINRRDALKLTFASGVSAMLQACGVRPSYVGSSNALARFETALPIPPVLEPTRSDEHGDYYELEARESTAAILPRKQTKIHSYNGIFPGPTIKATRGRATHVRFTNKLQNPVVTHLHGGHTPSDSDGWADRCNLAGGPSGASNRDADESGAR
jgi:spore coat protein A, manganese oxidase